MNDTCKPSWRGRLHQISFWAVLALVPMLVAAAHSPLALTAAIVYAVCLALNFGMSALYHRGSWGPKAFQLLRRLDHSAIYLVIAGTYTPVCLVGLPSRVGLPLLAVVWTGAVLGVMQVLFWMNAPRYVSTGLYALVGVAAMVCLPQIGLALGAGLTALMVAGGLLHLGGAVVYARKRPDPAPLVFGYHEIFHAFTVAASALHFVMVRSVLAAG